MEQSKAWYGSGGIKLDGTEAGAGAGRRGWMYLWKITSKCQDQGRRRAVGMGEACKGARSVGNPGGGR